MAQASPKSHIPYTIRYMARLQEQAAQSCETDAQSADLNRTALEMRAAVTSLAPTLRPAHDQIVEALPQKIKLLNWLRQSK